MNSTCIVRMLLACVSCLSSFVSARMCPQTIVAPDYPRVARIARVKGSVTLEASVSPNGAVASVKGSGAQKLLVVAAQKNLRMWTFEPAQASNTPTRSFLITYVYKLEGNEEYLHSAPKVIVHWPNQVEIIAHPPEPQP